MTGKGIFSDGSMSFFGLPLTLPASFPNATTDPVNVIAPITMPRKTSDLQNSDLGRVFLPELLAEGGETGLLKCHARLAHLSDRVQHDVGVQPDEDRRQADKGVKRRHQLRHFRHLHSRSHVLAHECARRYGDDDKRKVLEFRGDSTVARIAIAMPTIPYQIALLALSWFDRPPSDKMKRTDAAM